MDRIPIISGSARLHAAIRQALSRCHFEPPELPLLRDPGEAIDFLSVELPELVFVHFPEDARDARALLDEITRDPWLIRAGIIALCDDEETVDQLEHLHGANLLVVLLLDALERQVPRLLDIVHENRRVLLHRQIGSSLMREISGQFILSNDPVEARCYTNLVCSFLYYANRIDGQTREALNLAMTEILTNAIEHGNCGISYEEKTAWLRDRRSMAELIEQRCQDPEIARRRITFEYAIESERSRFLVADEGQGFNWRELQDATSAVALLESHGRGILMTRAVTESLTYNDKGNEARFEIAHQRDEASLTPGPLREMEAKEVRAGETVFRQGELGNFMYYIAKGRYEVIVGERAVAHLTPDDIFVGEMSFLLNNRRTATVRAVTDGRLIEISKKGFMGAIKSEPHYALLLSRLLAQRIDRANALQTQRTHHPA